MPNPRPDLTNRALPPTERDLPPTVDILATVPSTPLRQANKSHEAQRKEAMPGMGGLDVLTCAEDTAGTSIECQLYRGRRTLDEDGDARGARQWFDAAYRNAEAAGDAVATGEAALGLAGLWLHEQRTTAEHALLLGRIRHALVALHAESPLGLRLRLRLTAELAHSDRAFTDTLALAEEIRRGADVAARAEAAHVTLQCVVGPDHAALRHSLAEQLIADGTWHERRGDVLLGLAWRTVNLVLDGDRHANRSLSGLRTALSEQQHLAIRGVVDGIDVMRQIRAGQLNAASTRTDEHASRDRKAGDPKATERHASQLVAIRWYQGRIAELAPMLAELVDSPEVGALDLSCLGAQALAAATAGEERRARQALARLRQTGLVELPHGTSWLFTLFCAIEAAYLLGDQATADEAYQLLVPYADRPAIAGLGSACFGSVQHALGMAALTQAEPERAVAHLTAAIHANLALWHWPAAVVTRTRLAEALDRRGHHTDVERAALERQRAAADASVLGMPATGRAWPSVVSRRRDGVRAPDRHLQHAEVSCRNRGRQWEITTGQHTVRVGRMRGMQYLAVLIANPGQEIRASELAAGPSVPPGETPPVERIPRQPVLDDAAIRGYRSQLASFDRQIERHESSGAFDRVDQLSAERRWLVAELAAAAGLAGRSQTLPTNDELARVAVGKAIRRALDRITKVDEALGEHLRTAIHTGTRCVYQPAPDRTSSAHLRPLHRA